MPSVRLGFSLALAAIASSSCTTANVVAGALQAAQGFLITDAQELAIGQQTKASVLAETPEYDDPTVQAYVTRIGQKMVAQSERSTLAFEFHVLDSPEVNSFAAPGGFVFVTTPLLALMTNEAQLAGVVGHEVGHVAKRHSVDTIRETLLAQGVQTAVLGQSGDALTKAGANIAANLILKGFDRGKEEEADRCGAQYSFQAGYDCRELQTFLGKLGEAVGDTPAWLIPVADHPRSDDRVVRLNQLLAQPAYRTKTSLVVNRPTYQSAVIAKLGALPAAPASAKPSGT